MPAVDHPSLSLQPRENRITEVGVRGFDTARAVKDRVKLDVFQLELPCQCTRNSRFATTRSTDDDELCHPTIIADGGDSDLGECFLCALVTGPG